MLEFEKQRRYIVWHTDVTVAGSVVPFNVHASKFIAGHVVLHTMEFLEDTEEVVKCSRPMYSTPKLSTIRQNWMGWH